MASYNYSSRSFAQRGFHVSVYFSPDMEPILRELERLCDEGDIRSRSRFLQEAVKEKFERDFGALPAIKEEGNNPDNTPKE